MKEEREKMHDPYRYLLFDLDGTLLDSQYGIKNSLAYTLKVLGLPPETDKTLTSFLGPTIGRTFKDYYGFDDKDSKHAVEIFRNHFSTKNMYTGSFYNGIFPLLTDLRKAGYIIAIATSKYEVFTEAILSYFNVISYFDVIVGSNDSKNRPGKVEVIAEALSQLKNPPTSQVLMIGDRNTDIDGAASNGISALGVLYGYGNKEELKNAIFLANTVDELRAFLLPQ